MKDWFKARNIWGAAISALSDEEAGRLAKAIWAYTMTGEVVEIEGAGKGILAMILLTLGQDAERDGEISEKRSIAGKKGAINTNYSKAQQKPANDGKSQQMMASADNKNKNQNKNQNTESESEFISGDEARAIQNDHDRVLTAAEDAGFKMSNTVRAHLLGFYATYGLEKVLDGFKACVTHGATNLAYLEAVLKGSPRKSKPTVPAQNFEQRDYSNVQDELTADLARQIDEMRREVG